MTSQINICMAEDCAWNDQQECQAQAVTMEWHNNQPECDTYRPE